MQSEKILVMGGGQAAVQLCLSLRKNKVTAPVLMLSEESDYPYHKPPLSKCYLSGETDEEKLSMRPESFYSSKDIEVVLGCKVTAIEPEAHKVTTDKGSYDYQSLVIASGARPRELQLEGNSLGGVHLLRNLDQSRAIKSELEQAQNVVVVGAGFIGLEFAAVANKMNKHVTVLDKSVRAMARAVAPDVSSWFVQHHRANGIDLRLQECASQLIGEKKIEQVKTTDGNLLDCDLLVIGIGVVPNDEVAKSAGLACDDGIIVNEFCETSMADIYAAGDCAKHPNQFCSGSMIRLESIQNATDQSRTVASVLAGEKSSYHSVPWFWSDQGEVSLQMAGLSNGSDQFITRGSVSEGVFSVYHFKAGQLQCVDSINSPRDHMVARKLIAAGISPSAAQAADAGFDLKTLIR